MKNTLMTYIILMNFLLLLSSCDLLTEQEQEIVQPLKLTNAYFSDKQDFDNDNKFSYAWLYFEINTIGITGEYSYTKMDVRYVISYRNIEDEDTLLYTSLIDTSEYMFFSDGMGRMLGIQIGQWYYSYDKLLKDEIWEGCYDFRIQLYNLDKPDIIMYETTIEEYPELKDICFESFANDTL